MTIAQVLTQVEALTPSVYTSEEKLRWLSEAEGFLLADLPAGCEADAAFTGYDSNTDTAAVLRAEAPYDVLYRYYLEMQIHYANGETAQFDNARTLWNSTLLAYQNDRLRRRPAGGQSGALRLC